MNFFKFFISRQFVKHFFYSIIISVGFFLLVVLVLRFYTRHGQAIMVPDFTGIRVDKVKNEFKRSRFRFEITDSVYLSNKGPGTIIEQNPKFGSRVKKKRTIFFIINAFNPELVMVPNVVGLSFRQAKSVIESKGLKIGKLEYIRDIAVNNVLDIRFNGDNILSGIEIPKYSLIDMVLGNGYSNNYTYVPELTGLDIHQAKEKIIDSYCNLGSIIYDKSVKSIKDSSYAFVYKQLPIESKKHIKYGTFIDVWLTVDAKLIPKLETDSIIGIDNLNVTDIINSNEQ